MMYEIYIDGKPSNGKTYTNKENVECLKAAVQLAMKNKQVEIIKIE